MARLVRRLLTWFYVRFIRNYVLVDLYLTNTSQTNTLYVVHLNGGRIQTLDGTTTANPDLSARRN